MTKSDAPEVTRKAPKIIKRAMLADEIVVMIPNIPSSLYMERNRTSLRGRLAARNVPGSHSPRNRM